MKASELQYEQVRAFLLNDTDGSRTRATNLSIFVNWKMHMIHKGDPEVEIIKRSKNHNFEVVIKFPELSRQVGLMEVRK